MTNTLTAQPTGIMAARLNRGDVVEINDMIRTVEEIALTAGRLHIEFTDGTTAVLVPTRTVTLARPVSGAGQYPREVHCPVCLSRVTVWDRAEEKQVRSENGCGGGRCL